MLKFRNFMLDNNEMMETYTKAIAKVHGKDHPELHEVRDLYMNIIESMKNCNKDQVISDFMKLREITDDYKIPESACETYEKTYENLKKAQQMLLVD